MVKTVVGDEIRLGLIEDRLSQSSLTSQVGLVIGKLSSSLDRGFVFDLVPTPPNDAGEPPCSLIETTTTKDDKKRGSRSKSQALDTSTLVIDKDWVAEHSRQVSRMLLGGMNVVGIYVWVSDSSFKNSTITLCQTVNEVGEAAAISEAGGDERLLIHICFSPRRWTCRNCTLSSNIISNSLRPCDFKMGRLYFSRLPIFHDNASDVPSFSAILRHGISVHAKELRGAKAIIDGNLVVSEDSCTTDGPHEIELLVPFMKDVLVRASSQKNIAGLILFGGSVCSFAYLNPKETVLQATADIKDDIIRSLKSRLDIICDEADGGLDPIDGNSKELHKEKLSEKPVSKLVPHLLRNTCGLSFPRRVFIPWLGNAFICDYLQQSETLEILKDHCTELMSIDVPADSSIILQPEDEASLFMNKSFWDISVPRYSTPNSSSENCGKVEKRTAESSGRKAFGLNLLAAIFFLLLSVLLGFVFVRQS
ncbi:hypothetical protein K2173_027545 [Erythroxylum novogranatense]|uniref:Protein odr-4 homolog n=1 Tax=Erythroxylum novogranatense TaxID=1862640 RepID=A0AAV8U389_9ROSI|nr:hypothetical protein K2173_027545 [Erythroxylum novogranatense]